MDVSSDHGTRRCSRRDPGKALEKAKVLMSVVLCNSVGKERGSSVGMGRTSSVEEISCNVTSVGLTAGLINAGHSSNVFRCSISFPMSLICEQGCYHRNRILQTRD